MPGLSGGEVSELQRVLAATDPRVVEQVATWSIHGAQASERDVERLAAEYLELRRAVADVTPCVWREEPDGEFWQADCGLAFGLEDGTPEKNNMRFCPQCGKPLVAQPYVFVDDEDGA